jgi:DNA-binding MarR family transcriptional regulator/Holliday junction resolvase
VYVLGHDLFHGLDYLGHDYYHGHDKVPKVSKPEQAYENQLVDLFRDSGWEVRRKPHVPGEADLVVKNGNLEYVIELKRAPESRRDRVVPLLAEAIQQAQAYAQRLRHAHALAVIASPHLSAVVVDQALEFHHDYAPDVAVGFFDDRGFRVFRAPGLESLNSPAPEIDRGRRAVPESQSHSLFSDLGQWMLKVMLAQHIEPRFLNAPRRKIRNASELALAAGVSQVSASRLVRQLEAEGFLDRYADQLELVRVQDLLEEWQAAERRAFKEIPCRWVIPGRGRKQLESSLHDYSARHLRQQSPENHEERSWPRVCLGLFAAAEALGVGFVQGVPPVLYVERMEAELIRQLGISQERAIQADVYLRIPSHKEAIFRAAVEHNGVLVSDALQVWLDVSNHPSRGKEQADRIRDQVMQPLLSR